MNRQIIFRSPWFSVILCLLVGSVLHAADVDPAYPYAWSENLGWVNGEADGTDGLELLSTVISGYAWCENAGWLYWGDGTPDTPPFYSNASATDYGVNFNDTTGEPVNK